MRGFSRRWVGGACVVGWMRGLLVVRETEVVEVLGYGTGGILLVRLLLSMNLWSSRICVSRSLMRGFAISRGSEGGSWDFMGILKVLVER